MKSTILNVNKEQPKQPQQPQKQPNDHGKQQPSKSKQLKFIAFDGGFMAERPDLIDPVPEDDPIPGDDIPETPDVNDPLLPEDPDVVKPL